MFHNTTKVWEGIKNVKILTVNDLDHQVALAYACQGIREIDSDITIEIIDCTCKAVVPPIVENPVDDTMILFLGYVPNMMYLHNVICMVKDYHVIYIDNDVIRLQNLRNLECAKNINGLIIPNFSVGVLTYMYFRYNMRYATYEWSTQVFCKAYNYPLELTNPVEAAKVYNLIDRSVTDISMYTLYPKELQFAEFRRCCVYQNILDSNLQDLNDPGVISTLNDYIDTETLDTAAESTELANKRIMNNAYKAVLRKCEHLKVIAINTPEATGMTFVNSKVWDKFHLGISFHFDGNMWYKLWRMGLEPEKKINCAKIAESYGGHGRESYGEFRTSGQLEVLAIN